MNFGDAPEEAEFRAALRDWIVEHAPPKPWPSDDDARMAMVRGWHQDLARAGYIGLSFPSDVGGQGRPEVFEAILNDEIGRAGAPQAPSVAHIGHAIRLFGTDAQRAQHLPRLLSGEILWCQGFSEPGAGSDLAAIATRAMPDESGSKFVVNGHKIWTSEARWAEWMLLLARSEPTADAPAHRGLSILLLPVATPGVTVVPIAMATGEREFAEVFFDDVVVPSEQLLGRRGQGWEIAMALLSYERGPADVGWIARIAGTLTRVEDAVSMGQIVVRHDQAIALAEARVNLRVLQVHVLRSLSMRRQGNAPGEAGSIDKLLVTRVDQLVRQVAFDIMGTRALIDGDDDPTWRDYIWSRGQSIFGGSQQVQRNIVAQRILGLPRA